MDMDACSSQVKETWQHSSGIHYKLQSAKLKIENSGSKV